MPLLTFSVDGGHLFSGLTRSQASIWTIYIRSEDIAQCGRQKERNLKPVAILRTTPGKTPPIARVLSHVTRQLQRLRLSFSRARSN
jgi:hypothetical protein